LFQGLSKCLRRAPFGFMEQWTPVFMASINSITEETEGHRESGHMIGQVIEFKSVLPQ
jgi:hypothetical protein